MALRIPTTPDDVAARIPLTPDSAPRIPSTPVGGGYPLPILRLADAAVTLDDNTLATAGPTALGDTIRVSLQDAGGSGYADPTDGITIIWRARDQFGNPVSAPFAMARLELYVVTRPEESDSTITIEVGCCTGVDAAEYHGFGLYYNDADGTVHRRSTFSGTSPATSDLLVTRINRTSFVANYVSNTTDRTKSYRHVMGGVPLNDDGPPYTQFVGGTGAANLTGDDLYFYASVYPTGTLTNENTVAFQVRAVASGVQDGTWDWRGSTGAQMLWQIGDSITQEAESSSDRLVSNRYRLLEELVRRAPSRDVYPVGHTTDIYSTYRKHSGVPGALSSTILTNIATYIAALDAPPDIVTILLGTNDAAAAVNAATFGTNMQGIVDAILAAFPAADIYVAYPTPTSTGANDTVQQTYSAVIDALTGTAGVVDMRTGFNTGTMLDDAVHPNALGHEFIADKWAAAITLAGE